MDTQVIRNEGKHQIVVRMPVGLHRRLVEVANGEKGQGSVNAEICHLVERHLEKAA